MDFHLSSIFVNLSLLVFGISLGSYAAADERAVLADREPMNGRLEMEKSRGLVFRANEDGAALELRTIRRVERVGPTQIAPGTSPAHRLFLWGNESLSGTIQAMDGEAIHLKTPAGELLHVPIYLIARIEHHQGHAVLLREDFESEASSGRVAGEARRSSDQADSGRWSLRLAKPGDAVEYVLPEPIGSGWLEVRFWDCGQTVAGLEWLCELDFDSKAGVRTLQVLLGWESDSYGLATPQGPSFPVQRLARRNGWNRLGVQFAPDRTTALVDDAVLTHREVAIGSLRAIRFVVRTAPDTDGAAAKSEEVAGYVDDLQISAAIASPADRQPSRDQDDVLLTSGDQLFGKIESASAQAVAIHGEFGTLSVPWTRLHQIHFTPRPAPSKTITGQRVRVQFASSSVPQPRGADNDVLEAVVTGLSDEVIHLEHPHLGPVQVLRRQFRQMEFLSAGRWLAIDPRFHHLGDEPDVRLQVAHPDGTDRSWEFALDRAPERAALVLYTVAMDPTPPGGEASKQLDNDEWRTHVAINGQKLDLLGLNHLLPANSRGPVRLVVPVAPGLLKKGDNVLRIFQTPQKDNPQSFDDCGIFGIGLELSDK